MTLAYSRTYPLIQAFEVCEFQSELLNTLNANKPGFWYTRGMSELSEEWVPWNIPRKIPEMAMKWNFTLNLPNVAPLETLTIHHTLIAMLSIILNVEVPKCSSFLMIKFCDHIQVKQVVSIMTGDVSDGIVVKTSNVPSMIWRSWSQTWGSKHFCLLYSNQR